VAWQKGQSGNPTGKKPGLTARGRFRQQVEKAVPEIVENVIQAARGGDMSAIKLILDRCIPVLKPTTDAINLTLPAGDLSAQAEAVIQAAATGFLTPDQAKTLIDVISAKARILEVAELVKRLDAIEAAVIVRMIESKTAQASNADLRFLLDDELAAIANGTASPELLRRIDKAIKT
jgi:hypothetical protein